MFIKNRMPFLYRYLQLLKMNFLHARFVIRTPVNKKLQQFKNKYVGRRCFIVASGPSLTASDLDLIKNEISFGVNSCIKAFDKTSWRPTFLCVSDGRVWDRIHNEIESVANQIEAIFYGIPEISTNLPNSVGFYRDERSSTYLETEYFKQTGKYIRRYDCYIPKDMDRYFCDGPTVVLITIQLAIYMGFSEIYLLGTDCNFSGQNRYSSLTSYAASAAPDNIEQKLFGGYKALKRDISEQGLNTLIYNATRGGMLEVFERVNLDEVLQMK